MTEQLKAQVVEQRAHDNGQHVEMLRLLEAQRQGYESKLEAQRQGYETKLEARQKEFEIKLEAKFADAQAWCVEEEVDSLASLAGNVKDKAIADSLIGRLQIKPGKAKARTLLELIAERALSQPTVPVQMSHVKRQVSDQI